MNNFKESLKVSKEQLEYEKHKRKRFAKEIYEAINIGDQFEYVKGRDLTEEPYTRERN